MAFLIRITHILTVVRLGWKLLAGNELAGHDREEVEVLQLVGRYQ